MIRDLLVHAFYFWVCILSAYVDVRRLIWDIVWVNKKGKRRKLKDLKVGVPTWSRITMKYLLPYAGNYKRQFLFWYHFKRWFWGIEVILGFVDAYILLFSPLTKPYEIIHIAILVQGAIIFLFTYCQFDINWRTKYDRMHLKKVDRMRLRRK